MIPEYELCDPILRNTQYEPDQDDRITDEELNAEYEKMDEDLVEIEKQL